MTLSNTCSMIYGTLQSIMYVLSPAPAFQVSSFSLQLAFSPQTVKQMFSGSTTCWLKTFEASSRKETCRPWSSTVSCVQWSNVVIASSVKLMLASAFLPAFWSHFRKNRTCSGKYKVKKMSIKLLKRRYEILQCFYSVFTFVCLAWAVLSRYLEKKKSK